MAQSTSGQGACLDTMSEYDTPVTDGMPMLGLGTWENTDDEQCAESVRTALEMG